MKKTLLILSLSGLALTACSKSNQTPADANTASQATEVAASQAAATETVASQATASEATTNSAESVKPPVEGNAQASLDWNGTYKGVLPCASCEGIETKLELNSDKTYEIKETYLGKGDGKPFESKGSFQFDSKNPSVIELDQAGDGRKYFVAEGYLKALDLEGNEITGELADKYQLKKEAE